MSTISGRNRFNCLLRVEAPHWTSLIRVHNHLCQEVERSCGSLSFELTPGIYEVDVTLGQERQSRLVAVKPERTVFLNADSWKLQYRSAAPLSGTSTSLAAHEEGARRWSRTITWRGDTAAESRLFVFVRALNRESSLREDKGLRLLNTSGEILNNFSTGVHIDDESNYLTLTCDLPPGPYILHTKKPFRYQPLWLSPGYETQVFIPFSETLALDQMSVFMTRKGKGFDPDDQNLISTELIWQRLQRKQEPLLMSDDVRQGMLQGAAANPWLCILLIHAMHDLVQSSTDELLEFIPASDGRVILLLNFLQAAHPELSAHPDARALALSGDGPARQFFEFPPMLWRSLKLVQRHAASYFGTIPPDSFTDWVLDSLVLDGGWSAWRDIDYQGLSERDEASYSRLLEEADKNPEARPLYLVRQQAYEDSTLMRLARSRSFNEQPPEVLVLPENDLSRELKQIELVAVSRECGITCERAQMAISFLLKHPDLIMQPEIFSPSTQAAALYIWGLHERATDSPDEGASNSFSLEEAGQRLRRAAEEFKRLSTLSEQLARGFPLDSETIAFFKSTLISSLFYRKRAELRALIEQVEALSAPGVTMQDDGLTAGWLNFMSREWYLSLTRATERAALLDNAILITDAKGRIRAVNFALRYLSEEFLIPDNLLPSFAEQLSQASSSQGITSPVAFGFWIWRARKVVVKRANQDEVLAYLYLLRTSYYRPFDRKRLRLLDQLTSNIALHQTLIEYGAPQQRPAYLRVLWQDINHVGREMF